MIRIFHFIVFSLFSFSALAETYPNIKGDYWIKLQTDRISDYSDSNSITNDSDLKSSDTFIEAKPRFELNFKDYLALQTSWVLLNVKAPERVGSDRAFDDQGLVLEELFLNFKQDDAEFSVGKINPNFGLAWNEDFESGIWGADYGDEYRIVGRLGLEIKAKLDLEDYGHHIVSVNSFFNDETGLEEAIFTRRDNVSSSKGQAGNSGGLSSYTLSFSGKDFYNLPGLFYEFSYRNLDAGKGAGDVSDEEGYSLGVGSYHDFGDLRVVPFIEYAKINNFNSINNRFGPEFGDNSLPGDYEYLSMMLTLNFRNWSLHMNRLEKDYDYEIKSGSNQMEYSVSYEFKNGVSLSLGRKDEEDSSAVEQTTLGAMLYLKRSF